MELRRMDQGRQREHKLRQAPLGAAACAGKFSSFGVGGSAGAALSPSSNDGRDDDQKGKAAAPPPKAPNSFRRK